MSRFGGLAVGMLLAGAAVRAAPAQNFGFGRNGPGYIQTPFVQNPKYDGRFTFARLSFTGGGPGNPYYYRGMPPWAHGYDEAERNLVQILNSLSTVHPRLETGVVYGLEDPELFKYPLSYMAEADFLTLTEKEVLAFRKYLQKGGFVIFDDFRDPGRWGGIGWVGFAAAMQRVLPGARIVDLTPKDPIFHSFYEINTFSIIPQNYDAGKPVLRGIYDENDPDKRMIAMINFNTDVSQYWEFSGQGLTPISQSNEAYKMGVNYLVYAMSH